jgi:hypothetical protein
MNASEFTHGLKTLGLGSRMWIGVIVLMVVGSIIVWLAKNREDCMSGMLG